MAQQQQGQQADSWRGRGTLVCLRRVMLGGI